MDSKPSDTNGSNERSTTTMSNVQELLEGAAKYVEVPSTWSRSSIYGEAVGLTICFKPERGRVSINSRERMRPLSAKSAEVFNKLLGGSRKTALTLMHSQIRNLSEVLGNAMGDNQYTNATQYPSTGAPYFRITNAQLISANGRTVIEISGSFMSEQGKPTEFYKGILMPSGQNGDKVTEIFIAAPTSGELLQHESIYRHAIQTVTWR